MSRSLHIALAAAGAAAALAGAAADAARAGTISRPYFGSDTVIYSGAPGEANRVFVDEVEGTDEVTIRDAVPVGSAPGSLCHNESGHEKSCTARRVVVLLGDNGDTFRTDTTRAITVLGGAGDDRYEYVPHPGPSRVEFLGEGGLDTADYSDADGSVSTIVDDGAAAARRPDGVLPDDRESIRHSTERLVGSRHNDLLGADSRGGILVGGGGADRLLGTPAADVFDMGLLPDGPDQIHAGSEDTVSYARRAKPVIVTAGQGESDDGEAGEKDTVHGAGRLEGGEGDDYLSGRTLTQRIELFGGPGADTLDGGLGNDLLNGGPGRDSMFGRESNDSHQARDGEPDIVSCGGSPQDFAFLDTGETRVIGCIQLITEVGRLEVTPAEQRLRRGATASIAVRWKHPVSWRRLRSLEVAVRDDARVLTRRRMPVATGKGKWARASLQLRIAAAGRLSIDVTATDRRGRRQRELDAAHLAVSP